MLPELKQIQNIFLLRLKGGSLKHLPLRHVFVDMFISHLFFPSYINSIIIEDHNMETIQGKYDSENYLFGEALIAINYLFDLCFKVQFIVKKITKKLNSTKLFFILRSSMIE